MATYQSSRSTRPPLNDIPDVVFDSINRTHYSKGKFLGKGGFARCYELIDPNTNRCWAGKVVSKTLLVKKHQKEKMKQEIKIHKTLSHPHIVKLEGCFEDQDNVYILLELCPRRSLMELHKRRRALIEPEARYFVYQIVNAVQYLHEQRVIHRDLKLGNLFLNEKMHVKLGDFGLATQVEYEGERKNTLCGTPNYIAPEMLDKKGHSFEVDIWAIGCILFTLLVGKPPFETETLKETYNRIKKNQYTIPSRVGNDAQVLIKSLLDPNPARRPLITDILNFQFFTDGFLPNALPTSCLTMAPKFNIQAVSGGMAFAEKVIHTPHKTKHSETRHGHSSKPPTPTGRRILTTVPEMQMVTNNVKQDAASVLITEMAADGNNGIPADFFLSDLIAQLTDLIQTSKDRPFRDEDLLEIEDPASSPIYWISRWVDYSDKYGLGYQLCDNSVGVVFNDNSKTILDAAGSQMQYIERNNVEHFYEIDNHPPALDKKITLLNYFRNYMNEHLMKTGTNIPRREGDELARLPCLQAWFRTKAAIILHLSNGTLQINFFQDHSKLILCPLMSAATYINQKKAVFTYKFSLLKQYSCPSEMYTRLKYARLMCDRLIVRQGNSMTQFFPQAILSSLGIPRSQSTANMPITKHC